MSLLAKAGMSLHPWQEFILTQSLAERPDGLWSAQDVGLVVSRQNGKGEIIVARQLVGLFLLDEQLQIYTSHKFPTTMEMFRRLRYWLTSYKPFADRVKSIRVANGDVGVELKNEQRVRFLARTPESGRGFANVSTLYMDEAMYMSDLEHDALTPTTTAAANPQAWYVGSAGVGDPSRVFARIRRRGLTGKDPQLLWGEWSIPDCADPDDEALWGMGSPGLGLGQVTLRTLRSRRGTMSPDGFAREYLGRGDWPSDESSAAGPISPDQWSAAADPESLVGNPVVFALAVSLDGSRAAIGVCGRREDGMQGVEVVDHRPGTHWVAQRAAELRDRHAGSVVVMDGGTRANQLVPQMLEQGFQIHAGKSDPLAGELVLLSGQDITAAFGSFVSAVTEGTPSVYHRPHSALDDAVRSATVRHVGQALAWDGKNLADISPLVAVTLAAYAQAKWGAKDYDVTESVW